MELRENTFLEYSDLFKNYFDCGLCNKWTAIGDIYDENLFKIPICEECLEKTKNTLNLIKNKNS